MTTEIHILIVDDERGLRDMMEFESAVDCVRGGAWRWRRKRVTTR